MKSLAATAQFGRYCLAATQIALLFIFLVRFPRHLADPVWSAHEKAHLITQISASVGLTAVILFILYKFYSTAEKWVWWSLAALGVFVFGGYWMGAVLAEPDVPWRSGHIIFAVLSVCYLLGLAMILRQFMVDKRDG